MGAAETRPPTLGTDEHSLVELAIASHVRGDAKPGVPERGRGVDRERAMRLGNPR
jgi:hypothetical protein